MQKLVGYSTNVYSQFSQDGIVEVFFEIIGAQSKLCVEFDIWDT